MKKIYVTPTIDDIKLKVMDVIANSYELTLGGAESLDGDKYGIFHIFQ